MDPTDRQLTPLEKIDQVLDFLKAKSDLSASFSKEYVWNLYIEKTPELKIHRQLYEEIFKKLIEDGYINENKTTGSQSTYHLTLKGLAYDGYQNAQLAIQKIKQLTIDTSESTIKTNKFQRKNGRLIVIVSIATVLLSIATIYISKTANDTSQKALDLSRKSLELQEKELQYVQKKDSSVLNKEDSVGTP